MTDACREAFEREWPYVMPPAERASAWNVWQAAWTASRAALGEAWDESQLAALIASYNVDAPHSGDKETEHYPPIAIQDFRAWLSEPHDGDCTNQIHACRRCYAEEAVHMARWLIAAAPPRAGLVGEWREVADMPEAAAVVMLYWPTMSITQYPAIGVHHGDEYGWELLQDRDYGQVFPTHWMPLPPPPIAAAKEPPP